TSSRNDDDNENENEENDDESIVGDIIGGVLSVLFQTLWEALGNAIMNMENGLEKNLAFTFWVMISFFMILIALSLLCERCEKGRGIDKHDVAFFGSALATHAAID